MMTPSALSAPSPDRSFRTVALIIAALTVIRLIGLYFSTVDLFFDESQYWAWSRELALGYFSKPPLLSWLIAAAEHVCGPSEACIRSPSPVIWAATGLFAYAVGRTLYDARTGLWAAMLTVLGTGAVFSSRIVSTDVPLLLCWSVAMLAYAHLLEKRSWTWAVVLGVAIAGGMLAKYAMLYFVPGILIAAAVDKRARALLVRADLWLAFGVAVVVLLPHIAWNMSHGFVTVKHAGNNVADATVALSVARPLEFLGTQFGVFGPIVFGVAIAAAFVAVGRNRGQLWPQDRILLALAVPPLAVIVGVAVFVHAYPNWAAASAIPLTVFAAAALVRRNLTSLLWISVAIGLWAQVMLIGSDTVAANIRLPFLAQPNPYARTLGWSGLGHAAGELARRNGAATIAADARPEVASLLYYWRDQPEPIFAWPVSNGGLPTFEMTHRLTAQARTPVLFISGCRDTARLEKFYATVTPLGVTTPEGPVPRSFSAFLLDEPRGPLEPLAPCPK